MQHLFAPRCSLWKFWILAIVAWRILLRKCPLSSHESLFSIPCCREDRDVNPCSTSAFFATQLNFLELRLYFFAFRYDRGNISELSWFSWDADNSKLELTGEETGGNENCRRAAEKCHVKRQIASGGSTKYKKALSTASFVLHSLHTQYTYVSVTRLSLSKLGEDTNEEVCCVGSFVY